MKTETKTPTGAVVRITRESRHEDLPVGTVVKFSKPLREEGLPKFARVALGSSNSTCVGCCLRGKTYCYNVLLMCSGISRTDKTGVIFTEEKPE